MDFLHSGGIEHGKITATEKKSNQDNAGTPDCRVVCRPQLLFCDSTRARPDS
jgi:hypothetical protein